MSEPPPPPPAPHGFWQTVRSVAASFFGVQNARNRQHDFTHGKPLQFVLVGLAMTFAFIGLIWMAVKLALSQAGS